MMRRDTAERIEALRKAVGNNVFTEKATAEYVTLATLKKYDLIETIKEVRREEIDIEDLVAEINSMMGQDCYGYTNGEYVYENGKVYFETVSYGYRFK